MDASSRKEVRCVELVRRTPAFLGRDRAAVNDDIDAERYRPRCHETSVALEESGRSFLRVRG